MVDCDLKAFIQNVANDWDKLSNEDKNEFCGYMGGLQHKNLLFELFTELYNNAQEE